MVSALLCSLVLTLTVVPAAGRLLLHWGIKEGRERFLTPVRDGYLRILDWALAHRLVVTGGAVLVVAVALGSLGYIGTEFMPRLDEGAILIETRKLPSISLPESVDLGWRSSGR